MGDSPTVAPGSSKSEEECPKGKHISHNRHRKNNWDIWYSSGLTMGQTSFDVGGLSSGGELMDVGIAGLVRSFQHHVICWTCDA